MRLSRQTILKGTAMMAVVVLVGCVSPTIPYKQPVAATPPSGRVAVSQALMLFDASGSQEGTFAEGKATLESLVSVMPDGNYQAGELNYGGIKREATGLAAFDRAALGRFAKASTFLGGSTPTFDVLAEEGTELIGGSQGRAAIVLISDGLATDYAGRPGNAEQTVAAAKALVASRSGKTCFHAVQSGDDPAGTALLRQISEVTDCGSFRKSSSLGSASALQQFSRDAYLAAGPAPSKPKPRPTPVAATKLSDSDRDGVADRDDRCPNTLKSARVDERGCWTLSDLRFAVDGAGIEKGFMPQLQRDVDVLAANPGVRIRIDGHTDSDGSAAYNEALSSQRAASVRDYFVEQGGLEADRFEIMGFGESQPVAPNDTAAHKRLNRRVELTILD